MNLICLVFGHRYRPRFSTHFGEPTVPDRKVALNSQEYASVLEASKARHQVYECDLCERCGHTILKPKTSEAEDIADVIDLKAGKKRRLPKRSSYETVLPNRDRE